MKQQYIFVAFSLATGGAEKRLACITNHLARTGHDVKIILVEKAPRVQVVDSRIKVIELQDVACSKKNPISSLLEKCILKVSGLVSKKYYKSFDEKLRIRNAYARKLQTVLSKYPDAVVVSFMTFPSLATAMALKKLPNRWVFVECNSPHVEFSQDSPVPSIRKKLYTRACGAAFQTEEAQSYYTFLPKLQTAVIPNPIPKIDVQRYEGVRKKNVVTFCRMSYQKNIPLLIDAFQIFAENYPEYTLDIYGDGEEKANWMEYAGKSKFAARICFYDAEREIAKKLYDAGMFVSSSDREGISNAMLEALAVGLPCVCTDCPAGGARMFIKSYENGILVPVRDAQKMGEAMCYFAEHPEVAERCSKNAIKIRETLDETRIVTQWEEFLRKIGG